MPGSGKRIADAAAERSRSRERRRERYFSAREFARLEAALAGIEIKRPPGDQWRSAWPGVAAGTLAAAGGCAEREGGGAGLGL